MKTLLPYQALAGEVVLDVRSVRVDGRPLPFAMVSSSMNAVALHELERGRWDEAELEVEVTLPAAELAGGPWTDVRCAAVLAEGRTNSRAVRPLRETTPGTWVGSVPLFRARHVERAELSAVVVATVGGRKGRWIGGTEQPWVVDLKARTPARQRQIDLFEVDFREGPEEWLRPYRDVPWLVEVTGEMPAVYLNTGFEGVTELLNGSGSSVEKAVRDLVAAEVATEAWTAMFHAAVSALELDEDKSPQLPDGWRYSVLKLMLPDVFPGQPLADALFEVHERRSSGHGWAELQSGINYAASRRAQVPKDLTNVVRVLDRLTEGAGV